MDIFAVTTREWRNVACDALAEQTGMQPHRAAEFGRKWMALSHDFRAAKARNDLRAMEGAIKSARALVKQYAAKPSLNKGTNAAKAA